MSNSNRRGQEDPNELKELKPDNSDPLNFRLRSEVRQNQIDFQEIVIYVIVNAIQIAMTIVMTTVDFKMFSVILFFTAPMWVLTIEALSLLLIRLSK